MVHVATAVANIDQHTVTTTLDIHQRIRATFWFAGMRSYYPELRIFSVSLQEFHPDILFRFIDMLITVIASSSLSNAQMLPARGA
ncbi:MAG: hypothetical protein OXE41_03200 [Gammaproteobacteria bacterium]|nr:hypothetical protein [Gammaproteobacteria bacterium]MCY4218934.1 hypothetical protein [Gammaproteobacteria bacterium]MCY4274392.1 hypothetical protein [Gammaproteobacteria bacterium]